MIQEARRLNLIKVLHIIIKVTLIIPVLRNKIVNIVRNVIPDMGVVNSHIIYILKLSCKFLNFCCFYEVLR